MCELDFGERGWAGKLAVADADLMMEQAVLAQVTVGESSFWVPTWYLQAGEAAVQTGG